MEVSLTVPCLHPGPARLKQLEARRAVPSWHLCCLSSRSLQNGNLEEARLHTCPLRNPSVHASEKKPWDFYDLLLGHAASFLLHFVDGDSYKAPTRLKGRDHRTHLLMKVGQCHIVTRT